MSEVWRGVDEGPQSRLHHPEPQQLWFQIVETFEDLTYLQHGVEVGEGDVVFDVGANVGVAAVFFAAACKVGRVHSFEPIPPIFELLELNTRPYPACRNHMCAIGRRNGTANVTYYPHADAMSGLHADPERDAAVVDRVLANQGVDESERIRLQEGRYEAIPMECRVRSLSDVIGECPEERIDLLKIDVERSELDVLKGIGESDWPRIRQVVAEVHDIAGRPAEFDRILDARGYLTAWEQPAMMEGTGVQVVYAVRE